MRTTSEARGGGSGRVGMPFDALPRQVPTRTIRYQMFLTQRVELHSLRAPDWSRESFSRDEDHIIFIASSRLISYCHISDYFIVYCMVLYCIIFKSYRIVSYCIVLYYFLSSQIILSHFILYRIVPYLMVPTRPVGGSSERAL